MKRYIQNLAMLLACAGSIVAGQQQSSLPAKLSTVVQTAQQSPQQTVVLQSPMPTGFKVGARALIFSVGCYYLGHYFINQTETRTIKGDTKEIQGSNPQKEFKEVAFREAVTKIIPQGETVTIRYTLNNTTKQKEIIGTNTTRLSIEKQEKQIATNLDKSARVTIIRRTTTETHKPRLEYVNKLLDDASSWLKAKSGYAGAAFCGAACTALISTTPGQAILRTVLRDGIGGIIGALFNI